jgi:EAL domain-containing protein (putative c-di-GMP-specific phosphodiesterase class I)
MSRVDVPSLVEDTLREFALPASALWLEITESVLMHNRTAGLAAMGELASMGVTMCIDDFGTGYSSLGYLKDFPIHVVKVDRAFVSGLPSCDRSAAMTKAILDLVRALGFRGAVAEGVEHADQAAALEAIGCTWGQGFLWGPAQPASDIDRLIATLSPVATG